MLGSGVVDGSLRTESALLAKLVFLSSSYPHISSPTSSFLVMLFAPTYIASDGAWFLPEADLVTLPLNTSMAGA